MNNIIEIQIIESLRNGIPPRRGIDKYTVGYKKLIDGIRKYHLSNIQNIGKIRFVSGSWGSGKTHLFRLITDMGFQENCVISNVELKVDEAPLNKFELVFASIIRNIYTATYYYENQFNDINPFGLLLKEALKKLAGLTSDYEDSITEEQFSKAVENLMNCKGIDIDFKKIIHHYWKTYLEDKIYSNEEAMEKIREEIFQWFVGEGSISHYRKRYEVNKIISRQNSKIMLKSLVEFIKLIGYKGLIILFDEAEQSYSVMRKSALREAHNNLLTLINNIENVPGIFLIYATTPDFYTDQKHGIVLYGALASRIGKPEQKPPSALDNIWNLDATTPKLEDYQEAAKKIRNIYIKAYADAENKILNEEATDRLIENLYSEHSKIAPVRFWRIMVTALIRKFDSQLEGEDYPDDKLYYDIMEKLREDL